MEKETHIFNGVIADIVERRGMRQQELADALGITRQSVAGVVKQNRPMNEAAFRRYMDALGYEEPGVSIHANGEVVIVIKRRK